VDRLMQKENITRELGCALIIGVPVSDHDADCVFGDRAFGQIQAKVSPLR